MFFVWIVVFVFLLVPTWYFKANRAALSDLVGGNHADDSQLELDDI